MFRAFLIPAMGGLALSPIGACTSQGEPAPTCQPLNEPVYGHQWFNTETGESSGSLNCPEFEASCCPTSPPSAWADPLAGSWEVDPYVGGMNGCGSSIFRMKSNGWDPQTCHGSAEGTMKLGDNLEGCMDLYASSSITSYSPNIHVYCERFDVSVAAKSRGSDQYAITLLTTETSLDLTCSLTGDSLQCVDENGDGWNFNRQ